MATSLYSPKARMTVSRPRTVTLRASSETINRRASFGFIGAVVGSLVVAQQANAVKIPSQEFTGGLVVGGGAIPKSSTKASAEGYSLETGIKKASVSPSKKKEILANLKKKALGAAS